MLYRLEASDGRTYELELEPRPHRLERRERMERHERAAALRAPPPPQSLAFWTRPPFGFLWMLALVAPSGDAPNQCAPLLQQMKEGKAPKTVKG